MKVSKEDFSLIRMVFFTIMVLKNDINRPLFFISHASRSLGFYCYFWKYSFWSMKNHFYFSPNFFASLGIARQSMEKLGLDPSSGPIGSTLFHTFFRGITGFSLLGGWWEFPPALAKNYSSLPPRKVSSIDSPHQIFIPLTKGSFPPTH